MTEGNKHKILFVDDDLNVLASYRRSRSKNYRVDTATSGAEGLRAIEQSGPYAVIISDMRMPGMDGIQFLSKVREIAPDSVRIMLTGNADMQTAIEVVNEGHIFRFLTKPCPPEVLKSAIEAALHQYRLIMAEKELLESDRRHRTDLDQANKMLEAQVNERTKELEQAYEKLKIELNDRIRAEEALRQSAEQLRQAQKMEALGRLAGGIAHDFNNLLTAILGFTELALMKTTRNESSYAFIEEVRKAGERATALTYQLLAFSRNQVLQPKVFDLNVVVEDMYKLLCRLIGEDIELNLSLSCDPCFVKADANQIGQVVVNLVTNARDAMQLGGRLTIETESVLFNEEDAQRVSLGPGSYIKLCIKDEGCGIDEETRKRIFEPFFTTKESGKGTGMGLSTVYGIVQQSGGQIVVESELDRGTTFEIYLPKADEEAKKVDQDTDEQDNLRGNEVVLLVEDEDIVRDLARTTLCMNGYKVLEARNGDEALELFNHHNGEIHLLVTDLVMPQMNGHELSERLSAIRPEMKVLFMSGYSDNDTFNRTMFGADTMFLQKPFTPQTFAKAVRDAL